MDRKEPQALTLSFNMILGIKRQLQMAWPLRIEVTHWNLEGQIIILRNSEIKETQ